MNRLVKQLTHTLLIITAVVFSGGLLAAEQHFSMGNFSTISSQGPLDLQLTFAEQSQITAQGDEDLIAQLEIKQVGKELRLRLKKENRSWFLGSKDDRRLTIIINSQQLTGLDLASSSSAEVLGPWHTANLNIEVSGASFLKTQEIATTKFALELSGASRAELKTVISEQLAVELSGASRAELTELGGSKLAAELSGASSLQIGTQQGLFEKVRAEISGASRIEGKLATKILDAEISGASRFEGRITELAKGELSGVSSLIYSGSPRIQMDVSGVSSLTNQE